MVIFFKVSVVIFLDKWNVYDFKIWNLKILMILSRGGYVYWFYTYVYIIKWFNERSWGPGDVT